MSHRGCSGITGALVCAMGLLALGEADVAASPAPLSVQPPTNMRATPKIPVLIKMLHPRQQA
jgi:hypothetical protein